MANWQIESKCVDMSIDSILMSIYMWTTNHIFLFNMKYNQFFTFYVNRDCLLFPQNVKTIFEFPVMREKVKYFCVILL